jgi:hypothetical protein
VPYKKGMFIMEPSVKASATWALLLFAFLSFTSCSDKKSDESTSPAAQPMRSAPGQDQLPPPPKTEQQRQAEQPRPPAPDAPRPPAPPKPDPDAENKEARPVTPPVVVPKPGAAPAETKPAAPATTTPPAQSEPQKPAAPQQKQAAVKDVVVLRGAPLGAVRLEHKKHAEQAGNTCTACHHPSRPEKPLASPQQACSACHTKTPAPPMKTNYQAAFHNPTAQTGTCITCHKSENAKGKKAPVKCQECHKKENG